MTERDETRRKKGNQRKKSTTNEWKEAGEAEKEKEGEREKEKRRGKHREREREREMQGKRKRERERDKRTVRRKDSEHGR